MIGFIPIFANNTLIIESIIKYFLVQAGGSSLFLLSFLLTGTVLANFCFLIGMLLKLGVFPFYQWVPLVINSISWVGCLFLVTVQKLAPLMILADLDIRWFYITIICGSLRVLVSGILGFNQSKFRPLIAYSSVAHRGWIICRAIWSLKLLLIYILVYFLLSFNLFRIFNSINVRSILGSTSGSANNLPTSLLILTLAGLPPFSIFYIKIIVISYLIPHIFILSLIILGTILSVYYYLTFVIPNIITLWKTRYLSIRYLSLSILSSIFVIPFIYIL